jgi:hypothetical protein
MPTRLSLNSLNNDFVSDIKGGKKKKSSKKQSKLVSKKTSKLVSRKKSKSSKKPSKKPSKLVSRKKSKMSKKPSKMSKKPSKVSKKPSKMSKKPSKMSKKPSKMSKKSKSKVKRGLPLKLQAFQQIVKYLANELGGHSPKLLTLVKMIRTTVIEKNPNASVDDITKKTIEEFNKNKSKYVTEYQKLKKN